MLLAGALAWTGPSLDALAGTAVLYTAWFGLLLLLVYRRGEFLDRPVVLLGVALLLRAVFLPTVPDLSVDPYRYLWDGWLTASGMNPYRWVPSDPVLVHLHGDPLFQAMNSRDFFSIYPPLSQWLFLPAGAAYERLGWPGAYFVLKGTIVLAEIMGLLFLFKALRSWNLRPRFLALYAWNPLTLVTVAGVGHSEGGLVLGLGVLALGLARQRMALAWLGLGLAVLSKGIPLLLAPLLGRHQLEQNPLWPTLRKAGLGLLIPVFLSIPFWFPGLAHRVWASADLYVRLFEFNAGPYALLTGLLAKAGLSEPGRFMGPLLRVVLLAAAVWLWLRHSVREPRQVLEGGLLLFGLYLVTATTVHPWYLLWGLALIPFVDRYRAPWLWASLASFATYFVYVGVPETLVALLFWGGVAALVMWEAWPAIRRALLPPVGRRKARQIDPYVGDGRILDLGAGEGYVGEALRNPGRTLLLADIHPGFRVELPGFVFDGTRLPLPDDSVDAVVLSLVLHHCEDPDSLLQEALRAARLRVVITESAYLWTWERLLLTVADRAVNRSRDPGPGGWTSQPLHFDTVDGWSRRIRSAGGRIRASRRLNRIGHRHHLFVVEPPAKGASDVSETKEKVGPEAIG